MKLKNYNLALAFAAFALSPLGPLSAQTPPAASPSAPLLTGAMEPSALLKDTSVLIIALDNLEKPLPLAPKPTAPLPIPVIPQPQAPLLQPALPEATLPILPIAPPDDEKPAPKDDKISPFVPERPPLPAPITPAARRVAPPQIVIFALAKKNKKDKDKNKERFQLEPLPDPKYSGETRPNTAPTVAPPVSSPSVFTPAVPRVPSLTATGGDTRPGAALLAAAPLRRALVGLGLREDKVLTTSLDGPAVLRVLNSQMLPPEALKELQNAMSQIVYAPAPSATTTTSTWQDVDADDWREQATRAASRMGQTLGYRAVVVMVVEPALAPTLLTADDGSPSGGSAALQSARYTLLVADAMRDTGAVLRYRADGAGEAVLNEAAARIGAGQLSKELSTWPTITPRDRAQLIEDYSGAAQAAIDRNDLDAARDFLGRVTALDPTRKDAYMTLGRALEKSAPAQAAALYEKVARLDETNGEAWARVAIALTKGDSPDWVRSLQAADAALKLKAETAELRLAMANAEYGRAVLYRNADRTSRADEIELNARRYLGRAIDLAGDDANLTRDAVWTLAHHLVETKRYRDAVTELDKSAMQYPEDAEIQKLYATALSERGNRDEDAFVIWSRVWKLDDEQKVPLDPERYSHIANGFDMRAANLAKNAGQLANGVASGAVERVQALLLLRRLRVDMDASNAALNIVQPPPGNIGSTAHWQRVFAADLMVQAMENYKMFIETGQDNYRGRAADLHRQALAQLNTARATR